MYSLHFTDIRDVAQALPVFCDIFVYVILVLA